MARSRARSLTAAEAVLIAAFAYVVLLITLTGARIGREPDRGVEPQPGAMTIVQVADSRPAAALRLAQSECVTKRTVPTFYAAAPGVVEPLAFGPPVQVDGPVAAGKAVDELIRRVCYRPDPRLFAALDAAVNGRDPNRRLSPTEWAEGTKAFVTEIGQVGEPQVVTRTARLRTPTYGMQVRRGADPLVLRTRLARQDTSRYLVLPMRSARGPAVTLTLRLRCGFQPIF